MNSENYLKHSKKIKYMGPLFIVGCPRSGTSMLLRLINNIKSVKLIAGETSFLSLVYGRRLAYGKIGCKRNLTFLKKYFINRSKKKTEWRDHFTFNKWISEFKKFNIHNYSSLYIALMKSFVKENYELKGRIYIGSKNPTYLFYKDLLLRFTPNAKFINIIRDGRATTSSMINIDLGANNIIDAILLWKKYINLANNYEKKIPTKFLNLYYENIIQDPKNSIKKICDFLNVPFDISFIEFQERNHTGLSSYKRNNIKGFDEMKIDLYKKVLSRKQITYLESIAFDELTKHGYLSNRTEIIKLSKNLTSYISKRENKLNRTIYL
ncbi:MAG: sulfotransferase, partial [Promethearchaeota archaeon]